MYLEVKDLKKSYGEGGGYVQVLKGITAGVEQGEMCVIQGTSGSGKSTLLNCIGGLDTVDSGSIVVDGQEVAGLNSKALSNYRREKLGFIFQFYNLVPNLTVKENIQVCQYLTKNPLNMEELLQVLGLTEHQNKFPAQLSGGQQQRCAIARALIKNPSLLLCDEPTGSVELVQHYPKTTPVIFWSLSILISLMTERQSVRFSSRVKVSYIFLKSFCNSFSTAAKSGGVSCDVSGIWFNAAVYIS